MISPDSSLFDDAEALGSFHKTVNCYGSRARGLSLSGYGDTRLHQDQSALTGARVIHGTYSKSAGTIRPQRFYSS